MVPDADDRGGRRRAGPVHRGDRSTARRCPATARRRASTRQPDRDLRRHAPVRSTTGAGPGVPVYVRTGKRLAEAGDRGRPAVFQPGAPPALRRPAHPRPAPQRAGPADPARRGHQPAASAPRCPGEAFRVRSVAMDFSYAEAFPGKPPDAYERLLLDAMIGDADPVHPHRRGGPGVADRRPLPRRLRWRRRAPVAVPGRDLGPARGRPHARPRPAAVARAVTTPT